MAVTKIPSFKPVQKQVQDPKEKLRQAAEQYEQYFLNEMVKAMRGTIDQTKTGESTFSRDYFTQQLDQQYVGKWNERGGIGLADLIYNQISDRFFNQQKPTFPVGPVPIKEGTTIKIDESRPMGIPVVTPNGTISDELSFLYEWEQPSAESGQVQLPWDGQTQQVYQVGDNRQVIKVQHDNGLVSTISFLGERNTKTGDLLKSGEIIGRISADARGLTWQVAKVEPFRNG